MVARGDERAADFLREMLSHDLVVARKIEDMAGIREEIRIPFRGVSMMPKRRLEYENGSPVSLRNFLISHNRRYVITLIRITFFNSAQIISLLNEMRAMVDRFVADYN